MRRRNHTIAADDRGATLVELVISIGLGALTVGSIMGLLVGSARTAEHVAEDDPRVALAVDWMARDLREATDIDVVDDDGDDVLTLDVTTPAGTVRWGSDGGVIERTAPGNGTPQEVAVGLRQTNAIVLSLRSPTDTTVDPSDATAVDSCTRLVGIATYGADDAVLHQRTVSLRNPDPVGESC